MKQQPTRTLTIGPPPGTVLAVEHVAFHDTEILAGRHDETIYVPMKAFCGSIGLPWDGARRRIERDEVLSEGAVIMTVPSAGGMQRQLTLPLDLIHGFLFTADSNRYPPELRERVRTFRRTCYRVLADHFRVTPAGSAELVPFAPATAPAAAAIANAFELVEQLRTLPPGPVRTFYNQLLDRTCADLGMNLPIVEIDPVPAPRPGDRIDALLAGLRTLQDRHVAFNHFGKGAVGRFAINLVEIARLFRKHDIDVAIDDALRAVLVDGDRRYRCSVATVKSKIDWRRRPTLCVVVERADGGQL